MVLLCHGAFGYAHELSSPEAIGLSAAHSMHVPKHTADVLSGSPSDAGLGDHLSTGGYFAVVIALLFGALALVGDAFRMGLRLAAPVLLERRFSARSFPPSTRGPTVQRLQVFRL